MPIVPLKNTTYYIHVLHLDKYGAELPEVDGSLLSDTLVDRLQVDPPVSDVMICSHGFNVVPTRASKSYTEWLSAMAAHREGVEKMKAARGDPFVPLLIGIHWPSCVGGTLRAKRDTAPDGLTATDVGKGLLKGLFRTTVAVAEGVASGALEARDQFGQGMSLWDQAVAVGGATTKPLANEVFGRFEERAQMVGSTGVRQLLWRLQTASMRAEAAAPRPHSRPITRYHAMGHSLGCHVVCAAIAGAAGGSRHVRRPLHSLILIQGAMPCTAFSPTGCYPGLHRRVAGVILVTHSSSDNALGWYMQHGPRALGAYGAAAWRKGRDQCTPVALDLHTGDTSRRSLAAFRAGQLINLNASSVIRNDSCATINVVGSHMNFLQAPVLHAVWEAMATPVDRNVYTVVSRITVRDAGEAGKGRSVGECEGGAPRGTRAERGNVGR